MENQTSRKRILLTGASGTVGFETLQHLVQHTDYEITVFDVKTQKSVKKLAPFRSRVEIVYGDISNREQLLKVAQNKDVAIHLAAVIPPLADINPNLAYNVNVKGTENLIYALEKNSPECYLIFSSSISVYGDRIQNPEIIVSDVLQPSPGDQYGQTKVLCESLIRQSKLSWSIFRLAAIMGNHKISPLMFHMPLETPIEICTPKDTGRAFCKAIEHQEKLEKQIFNLGGGEDCVISYKSFLDKMFAEFGLGNADFPQKAFAEKNFHCGILKDGDDLDNILGFRQQNLKDYFQMVRQKIHPMQKKTTFLFRSIIKKWLLSKSDPYKAHKKGNLKEMNHFFTQSEDKKLEKALL
ncbi:UDP-glucose 4-epimerase [Flavobacterium sp. ACN2]|uniref:NAD-dependent epimerase/dehydratase family protein n=1 Tax=unclassified Flavobacterium TaxID=196869 RepID=UPI000BB33817|nr:MULTISPECIES: NAD(P)-dependent oxidoreductase [unclassified Flavobacterium]MDY0988208.1 NAD(P)-dependent oxidoreductase [Flavobacterium sp. CFBP9031]PBI90207.1 UDP-glucose 4-epimerase [Flavobacterium sp. ACN2]